MCGIAGLAASRATPVPVAELAGRMAARLAHRGPDAQDTWSDPAQGIALGHRRLSIIDLSLAGAQPMRSHDGRFTLTFNGELYGHEALRAALDAESPVAWRGHSDTEVLLEAMARWGVQATLARATGMFAFALWDAQLRTLTLARDRFGEKPLYYGWVGDTFAFASELKALSVLPGWAPRLDRQALSLYLRYNCVPAPRSIWEGVAKLEPGCFVVLDAGAREARSMPAPQRYWSLHTLVETARANPFRGTLDEAATALDALLREAVRGQMASDVPLGAFLSGGIDSSAIVAAMQSVASQPVKTFTVGFGEPGYDEAASARAVAAHLGTEHHELVLTPKDALDLVPKLPAMYDEPFADSSQLPTHLVARMAREHVTVSLSGDGGDEVFGGYNRYQWIGPLARRLGPIPRPLRAAAASIGAAVPARWSGALLAQRADRLPKLLAALDADGEAGLYASVVSHWSEPSLLLPGVEEPASRARHYPGDAPALGDFREWMMYTDTLTYLPDDILVKVDRAAMAVGLETRVPFLDPAVVAFAWSLPVEFRAHPGEGKRVLRRMLQRHVPAALVERPKAGFAVPLSRWLRGELREWAEALLAPGRLASDGVFDPAPIRAAWEEHASGRRDWPYHLWDILMFQAWLDEAR